MEPAAVAAMLEAADPSALSRLEPLIEREWAPEALAVGRTLMTHMCIDTCVRASANLGFECLLAPDVRPPAHTARTETPR
ncbi:MAG: hypothetical protein ACYCX3_14615 [Thermoleophilia bacterium]